MLCHLLLISIVLSTYAFLSCVHSMFHLFIRYVYHIFVAYIFYSSTYHLIYYLSNGSYYISYSVHVIFLYIYYFHGYILYTICYVLISCTVIMYYFHALYYHIIFSYHFIFLYIFIYHVGSYNLMLHNLSSHSNAMLLRSCHIFSHYFLFHACKYQRSGYRKLIRARRHCYH